MSYFNITLAENVLQMPNDKIGFSLISLIIFICTIQSNGVGPKVLSTLVQDQDSLLVKHRNDNHSPGPVIRELVPSSHQRSELSNIILCIFSG